MKTKLPLETWRASRDGLLKAELQQQRLPPDTSSQFVEESRSRLGLPRILLLNRGSRLILPSNVLTNRALALDFPSIYYRIAGPA